MARRVLDTVFVLGLFGILPPLGFYLSNRKGAFSLTFPPPLSTDPGQASFSWAVFGVLAFLIGSTLAPFLIRVWRSQSSSGSSKFAKQALPWWGWGALGWILIWWLLVWMRMPWMTALQPYTFPFLWSGYIVFVNALTYARSETCLLLHRPALFLKLFPLSAVFWWVFEYFNQFVNNWHYVNLPELSPLHRFLLTSLSFSTVLPAVLSTTECLQSFQRLTAPFKQWYQIPQMTSPVTGWLFFCLGSAGLLLVGIWPTILFPALWLSPLFILLGYKLGWGRTTDLHGIAQGNWQPVVLPALAALICGLWWECWNAFSLIHWEYTIPFVHGFQLFEMPLLGYAGYLPFGLECMLILELFWGERMGTLQRGIP